MKVSGWIAATALLLAACSTTPEIPPPPTTISEISVSTDLQAIGNADSVSYWQTLERDLEAALATEFIDSLDAGGAIVSVDVDEISLANAYSSQFQGENSRLAGRVRVTDRLTGDSFGTYDVTATAREAATLISTGSGTTTISPDSDEFYRAVVQAFARGVAQTVRQGG